MNVLKIENGAPFLSVYSKTQLTKYTNMKIKEVSRGDIRVTKKSTSKFRPLLDALGRLVAGGNAIEVTYANDKELNSMRNVVYTYNRETGNKIKSGKDSVNSKIYFYKDKGK